MEPSPHQQGSPALLPKPRRLLSKDECAAVNAELDHREEELFAYSPQNNP